MSYHTTELPRQYGTEARVKSMAKKVLAAMVKVKENPGCFSNHCAVESAAAALAREVLGIRQP